MRDAESEAEPEHNERDGSGVFGFWTFHQACLEMMRRIVTDETMRTIFYGLLKA
jgi:hypothetical protein